MGTITENDAGHKKSAKLINITYTSDSILYSQIDLKYPLQWKNNITEKENSFQIILENMTFIVSLRNTTSDSLDEYTFNVYLCQK